MTANSMFANPQATVAEVSDESALDQLLNEVLDPSEDVSSLRTLSSNASMNAQLVQLVLQSLCSGASSKNRNHPLKLTLF